jgi:hypothetical protein
MHGPSKKPTESWIAVGEKQNKTATTKRQNNPETESVIIHGADTRKQALQQRLTD